MGKYLITLPLLVLLSVSACTSYSTSSGNNSSVNGGAEPLSNIAKVETMSAIPNGWGGSLDVELKPINAKANTTYIVDLYEKGNLKQSQNITWNQPQINVGEVLPLEFNLSEQEYGAYSQASENSSNWWKSIFSVTITN